MSKRSSYRQILQATSIFGGVQVIQIIIGIVRVKFVAVLLGAAGVGIIGLLNSPRELIIAITGLGISLSAVRNISEANAKGNSFKIGIIVTTLRKWSWITGIFGAIVMIFLSPFLSEWSFGNREFTWAFIWLSLTVFLEALRKAQSSVLQGTRRLKDLATASVIGSLLGLLTSIPLYYFFGTKGIIPAMIITAVTGFVILWLFARKIGVCSIKLSPKRTFRSGYGMAKLGISMTAAGFIASLSKYVLLAFVSNRGGVEEVGLYNAGWGVVGQYTGVVFAAMATDYFPRLSAVQSDNSKIRELVSQQTITAILILTPLLSLLIVLMPQVIRILYTSEFIPVVMFANLTVIGMMFKTVSWAIGYVLLAKSDGKLFLLLEIIGGAILLGLNLIFYYEFGLNGLGLSFTISYIIGILLTFLIIRKKYDFKFSVGFYKYFSIAFLLVLMSFVSTYIQDDIYQYLIGSVVFILAVSYSVIKLNKLAGLSSILRARIGKKE